MAPLVCACATGSVAPVHSGAESKTVVPSTTTDFSEGGDTRSHAPTKPQQSIEIQTPSGQRLKMLVETDRYVRPDTGVDVRVIAEFESSFIIVDSYMSQPGGASYCQAGQEEFLRVLRIDDGELHEALRLKLASCWQSIELIDPGLQWSANDSTLRIDWLLGPSRKQKPEQLTLHFGEQ